ncbi:MAG: nuclear transport factor 2 family protein [Rhodospirillaceae bacterium]|nr:MAG: nuclear transport factor 2 family protein [Rhodospirillaceae bacterium]
MTMPPGTAAGSGNNMLKLFDGFAGKTLEQRVQEIVDREEIRELAARYAQRVVRRQSMADMFTDDGVFIVRLPGKPVQEARGRAQLDQIFAAAIAQPSLNMPAIHNHVISIAGDEATELCWIELYTLDDKGRHFTGAGCYEDRLRRENGCWKFVVRDCTVLAVGTPP